MATAATEAENTVERERRITSTVKSTFVAAATLTETFGHGGRMPFPDAERAVVTEEKVRDDLLNPNHPVGGPKASWFASVGYSIDSWQDLVDDLLQLARSVDDFVAKPSPYGVKYQATGRIGRPGHRRVDVITVWIVEGNSSPRLITAYPG